MSRPVPTLRAPGWRDVLQSVAGLTVVVLLIAYGMPYLLDTSWAAIGTQLSRLRAGPAVAMGVLLLAGLYCYTFVLTGSLPGLRPGKALRLNAVTATIANLVPLGAAVGVAVAWTMLRTWGFSRRAISSSVLVTGVLNLLARVALPVLGCLVLVAGPVDAPAAVVAGAWVAGALGTGVVGVTALVLLSDRVATAVAVVVRVVAAPFSRGVRDARGTADLVVGDQRQRIVEVLGSRWGTMTLGMAGQFLFLFGLYWLAARTVGMDLPVAALVCAYTFRQLLTVMAVTPGGLGVTEVGTAGVLVLLGGDAGAASATALLYAVYAHLLVVPFGLAAIGHWWVVAGRRSVAKGQPPAVEVRTDGRGTQEGSRRDLPDPD
ncbi:MAG TPA: lysylphosphatidylglycerol synthase transmembrane domain-containing protein [Ornithinimicrobium sp.]|nr:lysylphosphatidylglycerol synthase transmembrane domain-containing protein [Ornithinimicrobium sp.]